MDRWPQRNDRKRCKDAARARRAGAWFESLEQRRLLTVATSFPTLLQNGELSFANYLPQTHDLKQTGGMVSPPTRTKPLTAALSFIRNHAGELGLSPKDLTNPFVTNQYTDSLTGLTHIYLQQEFNDLPVANATMVINVMRNGSILSVSGGFVPGLGGLETGKAVTAPPLTAVQALSLMAPQLALSASALIVSTPSLVGSGLTASLLAPALSLDTIPAKLMYVPTPKGLQLAWDVILRTPDGNHWYDVAADGASGQVVFANDWTDHASYNVLPRPTESIDDGSYVVVSSPEDPLASPFGWHDTNGVAGAEFTDTRGNNVDAHLDRDANNSPDPSPGRPDGGASLDFSGYSFDPAQAPTVLQNQNIAQVNLFYWNNILHDVHYKYGFTEAAGNFQTNNYGRGGTANDAVQADAQDGSGTNNANFATPPDGSAPRMQMYLFTGVTPNRDGDLDNPIMIHEYGHGVSNRLTGGPANSNALNATQSGGMGEGWSDWWGLMLTLKATDTANSAFPLGTYVLGQTPTGAGIRRYPYSFDMSVDPLTVQNYNSDGAHEVHNTGEIWCSALFDMAWMLINKYGFDPNIQNGLNPADIKGNELALQLVMDALKIQAANPSFLQARDAILLADQNLHASLGTPLNQLEIWTAFARRGMGASFIDSSSSATSVTPAFDVPSPDPIVIGTTVGPSVVPISSIDFKFNQAIDPTSFSVVDDVASFTGPGATDIRNTITSFQWVDASTLRINFTATSAIGGYTLVIGPNILAADDLHPMNQDLDETSGEIPDDRFTLNFTYNPVLGPDGFGYTATQTTFENIDLVPGAAGVTSILDGQDDAATSISLGSNTFSFYGTTYTGANQLFISSNGLISFGSSNNDYSETNLSTSPSQPIIAPFWDDLVTNIATSGATNDVVLYQFQDQTFDGIPDRLIVEWSNVFHYLSTASPFTFQAILKLNTGLTPGEITFNYVDLNGGDVATNNGASASEGIKAAGSQGPNRLLIATDNGSFPWIGSGTAIRIATTPPADADPAVVTTNAPSGGTLASVSSLDFGFSEAMDTASFSVASDIVSFTGPGGTDLKPTISSFSWVTSTTLRINFTPITAVGNYSFALGPNILAADNAHAMDQNQNGTPGEIPGDQFSVNFSYLVAIGPDGFGYRASPFPLENIDLVPSAAGVVTLLDAGDDDAASIDLGSNSFNFYGIGYTGPAQLFVSSNGLITFGAAFASYANTDLTSLPTTPGIAPLWDDFVTNVVASGAQNDAVLYRLDDLDNDLKPDRLVIEWSNIFPFDASTASPMTFQAILQLNTSGAPGRIIFNYVDLDANILTTSNGASATEGVKAAGTQGANRLLIATNNGSFPWVGSGKAIVIGTDVTPPTVVTENYAFQSGPALRLGFTENVQPSLGAADFELQNLTTPFTVLPAKISVGYDSPTNTAIVSFPGYASGILPDGNYRLTVHTGAITDAAGNPLDGDGNGSIGGDLTFDFFVLGGDANRDRRVDIADLQILTSNWLGTSKGFDQGDFNYDGVVNAQDMNIIATHWQTTLAAPASATSASSAAPAPSKAPARKAVKLVDSVMS